MTGVLHAIPVALVVIVATGCAADTPADPQTQAPEPTIEVSAEGLLDDTSISYVVWAAVGERAVALGRIDSDGSMTMPVPADTLDGAMTLLVSVEPPGDALPDAPGPVIVAGDVEEDESTLSTNHPDALDTDFADAEGTYVLGTPTDPPAPEASGIWFMILEPRGPSLDLPALPAGWTYEAWVTVDGVSLPTGRFGDAGGPDDAAPFSGPDDGPPFPGEDFVQDPPNNLTFPVDLSAADVSVFAVPDGFGEEGPAGVEVLSTQVPDPAADHVSYPFAGVQTPQVNVRRSEP